LPLYAVVDWGLRTASARTAPNVPWINYARVPGLRSGLLLLVYFPLIGRKSTFFERATTFQFDLYWGRWLLFTAVVFALAAVAYGVTLARSNSH
ncbi:MAG: hypothetical protein JWL70_2986, partial [Acidimicrobiia bacterium]|nr:hypothetical protein [Acidimicrobiia bacterium]